MQVSIGLIVFGIIIFTSNKFLDNEKLGRTTCQYLGHPIGSLGPD